MKILFDTIGEENFESLNELFHTFVETFNEFEFLNMLQSRKKGEETDKTKQYDKIIEKRNQILELMNEYSKKRDYLI